MRYIWFLFLLTFQLSCGGAPLSVEQQARAMQAVLRQAEDAYYNKHQSILSDAAYDALQKKYQQLIVEYPELATEQSVGALPNALSSVQHSVPVLSLDKVYSDREMVTYLQKTGSNLTYCIEPKIDGLTIVLRYSQGLLIQALTRGDGTSGEDVTQAIIASGAVPLVLEHAPLQLTIRGELFLPIPAFDELNLRRRAEGQDPLKNPRNVASGTLQLADHAEIRRRGLAFQSFELVACDQMPATHTASLDLLRKIGLPVVDSTTVSSDQVLSVVAELNTRRADLSYMTDGLVIKVDDLAVCARLGATAHHPRSAVARKYEETSMETRLLAVEWSQGASGKWTPIAQFEPIEMHGATIQRATLHSEEHLRAMDLKIGDWINVIRAGGTIPEITGNLPERRTGQETEISQPGN